MPCARISPRPACTFSSIASGCSTSPSIKPVRHPEKQVFSDGITVDPRGGGRAAADQAPAARRENPRRGHDAPEAAPRKEQLAADLHYLLHIGHVIEFSDGALDLPLSAKGETPPPAPRPERKPARNPALPPVPGAPEFAVEENGNVDSPEHSAAETLPEEPPPGEEEPVPGEEEGEADPAEAASLAPIEPAEPPPAEAPATEGTEFLSEGTKSEDEPPAQAAP